MIFLSLYSRKLHCFCCRESTALLTSRTARAFSLVEYGLYHLVSRTLPCRLMSSTKWIIAGSCERRVRDQAQRRPRCLPGEKGAIAVSGRRQGATRRASAHLSLCAAFPPWSGRALVCVLGN